MQAAGGAAGGRPQGRPPIAPSWPPCSVTACAARSCAGCGSRTCRAVRTWCILGSGGKRGKVRFAPVHAMAQRLIEAYLAVAGHGADAAGPVFRPVTNNRTKELDRPLNPNSIYRNIVLKYGRETGVSAEVNGLCVHSLRATAATNPLSHYADIAKVQEWAGHPQASTTPLDDPLQMPPVGR